VRTLTGREAETIFFEQLRRSNAPELQELEIWMNNAENLVTLLISGSTKLTRLQLPNGAPQDVSQNHLSRLSQHLTFAFPVISCPNLTALIVMVKSDIMVTGTNIWKLKLNFSRNTVLARVFGDRHKDAIVLSIGGKREYLMLNDIDDINKVAGNILAVFPNLQTLYLSGVSLRKPAIS
jgi:hypothetical protein